MKAFLLSLMLGLSMTLSAQQTTKNVDWSFTTLMIEPGIYSVHAQAQISYGWILPSQHQLPGHSWTATEFIFKNLDSKIKILKIEEYPKFVVRDRNNRGYVDYQDFEMRVVIKDRGTGVLDGIVRYRVVDNHCISSPGEEMVEFNIKLD